MLVLRKCQRQVSKGQYCGARGADAYDGPRKPRPQQNRTKRDLQQVQPNEWVAGAAAQVELKGQRAHIDQQCNEKAKCRDVVLAPAQPADAGTIEGNERCHHKQHGLQRQRDVQAIVHQRNGDHLPYHREPAQLHQQVHVAAVGSVGDAER